MKLDKIEGGRSVARGLALFLLAICPLARAGTYKVNAGQSSSAIQRVIRGLSAGDTVFFEAGTYTIARPLDLRCGVTYTGPVATPATAILSSTTGEEKAIFNLYSGTGFVNPCKEKTTIQYLHFKGSGGIYVQTSFTNLTIQYNQFTHLPCCREYPIPSTVGITFDGGQSRSNTAQDLTNTLVQWNTFGDATSCTSPTNVMMNTVSPETNQGACNGMIVATTLHGLTINNNNFYHLSEGVHITCPGGGHPGGGDPPPGSDSQPCEVRQNGVITNDLKAWYNDFSYIHRIPWEQQPQNTKNVDFQYNSIHDWISPYYGSFGVSFACCGGGTNATTNVSNNVIVLNTTPVGRYGYGSEDWGAGATYLNNWIGTGNFKDGAPGMAWGYGSPAKMSNNTVCGGGFVVAGHIVSEGYDGVPPPIQTGNVTAPTCSPATSAAPDISPSSGPQKFPLTVTLTIPPQKAGPYPQGNTGIWYTKDGSTPTPGSGTAQYLASGGKFTLEAPGTVKAVGMWGAPNQPTSYPTGYGFIPSAVKSAQYGSGVASQQRPR
jgi:hypothetical protein